MEYIFRNTKIVVSMENKNFKFIKSLAKGQRNFSKFITFDIETRTINNVMIPYCICFYDGLNKYSFYLSDFNNSDEMITKALRSILTNKKYDNHIIFAHNFSKFDGIFILKCLVLLTKELNLKMSIVKRDSDFININVYSDSTGFSVNFRDSLLLLPSSLRKLAKSFGVSEKTIFPYNFVNNYEIDLNYVGNVPNFNYFDDLSIEKYNEYASKYKNNWNLKFETIKYCLQDCVTLYQVIKKFCNMIYKDLKVNLRFTPTTSSLALRTFRTTFPYSSENGIPIIVGDTFDFIKQSFTGGHVDVYNPYGTNVYHYDVNSLYPSVMNKYKMAVGNPSYFEASFDSNILTQKLTDNRPYGFFEVDIITSAELKYPIIQTRVNTNDGYRTVAPLGTWRDVLSSTEIYNAMDNFGYKFKVIRGYIFEETDIIFDKYVDYFNNIKSNTPKSNPMYLIAKLLMNGLFGKTGQDYRFNDNLIVNNDDLLKLIQDKNIEVISFTELTDDLNLVTIFNKQKYSNNMNILNSYNGCIAHASAIAAGARVEMSLAIKYLIENDYTIYYMDTDSLFVNKPLPEFMISNSQLGLFKLENIYKKAIFLAPKVYAGITTRPWRR